MSVIRHRTVRIDDTVVFVREAGDPARPTLVLLHGFPSSSRHYVRLLDRLAERRHVVAPHYPRVGQTQTLPPNPPLHPPPEITPPLIATPRPHPPPPHPFA